MNDLQGLVKKPLFWLALFFIFFLSFFRLQQGSLHNSDDALYAQVSREVSQGHIWPLTYSNNPYTAKPPLPFWTTGLFVKLFGDREFSYRLLSALSYVAIALTAFIFFCKRSGMYAAWLALLLFAGSPNLAHFSRRFMLDLPLCACLVGMLLAATSSNWIVVWSFACLGWLTKEYAILPGLIAVAILTLWKSREELRKKSFWIGSAAFTLMALFTTYCKHHNLSPASAAAIRSNVLPIAAPRSIYLDFLISDHPFVWLALLMLPLTLIRHRTASKAALLFALATILQLTAIHLTQTILPHYFLPVIATALLLLATSWEKTQSKIFFGILLAGCLVFVIRAHRFQFQANDPDFDPAPATKILAKEATKLLPNDASLCVVDTYLAGFRFYADRPTTGIYTTPIAYNAVAKVTEFSGMIVPAEPKTLDRVLSSKCSEIAIFPSRLATELKWDEVSTAGHLTLARRPQNLR